jgi:AcrR family transcriptional regulator
MGKTKKGQKAKLDIVTQSRDVFNRRGIHMTLGELASELGLGVSFITNHFRTKDHLIVAIAEDFNARNREIELAFSANQELSLLRYARHFSVMMDNQYLHRCAIVAIFSFINAEKELFREIREYYPRSKDSVRLFVRSLVAAGYLEPSILQRKGYDIFAFQFVNLFMSWVVDHALFNVDKTYEDMKPIYLAGIMSSLYPYFTEKGRREYDGLNFRKISQCQEAYSDRFQRSDNLNASVVT